MQPTLLRVLETWEVRPVGSSRDVAVDVRVVAASNRELVTLVQQGMFRADLYGKDRKSEPKENAGQPRGEERGPGHKN